MNNNSTDQQKEIVILSDLKGFFFRQLSDLNKKSLCPIPEPILFYSSDVLQSFTLSQNYFDIQHGRVREKILGIKLLEATSHGREEQKKIYKEVADMALIVCGYFSKSIKGKVTDSKYYANLGQTAYRRLNSLVPELLDISNFYHILATSFESLTTLLMILSSQVESHEESYVIKEMMASEGLNNQEKLMSGIILSDADAREKKVS